MFTVSPKRSDPAPGPRPAPELARFDRLAAQADGRDPTPSAAEASDALGVLAEVLGRDGQALSASRTRLQALSDADHLAVLHAIWTAETSPAGDQRYRDLLTAALPPGYRQEPSHREKWLWKTLHAAELAGLDAEKVVADAIGERDLTGARDIHAVIDSRIRRRTGALVPLPALAWSGRLPEISDPERRAYIAELAVLMDARKERIGEHAAASALRWAVGTLGPVPADPAARREWQHRSASIGAYRELSGYTDPADPIGPEPTASSPDLRAAWYEALAAVGPVDGPDVRGMLDGRLLRLRDTYPIETAWAPPWTSDELRRSRTGARDAHLGALRATANADAAHRRGEHEEERRHQSLAASYHALHQAYREREAAFAAAMEDRTNWERATRQQRQLAVAAAAELRRRHPGQPWPPLRSAEPELDRDSPEEDTEATSRLIEALAVQHREFAAKLADRQSIMIPAADPDFGDLGPAFPAWTATRRDAILQPPKPEIVPSARILERLADRDRDMEPGD